MARYIHRTLFKDWQHGDKMLQILNQVGIINTRKYFKCNDAFWRHFAAKSKGVTLRARG